MNYIKSLFLCRPTVSQDSEEEVSESEEEVSSTSNWSTETQCSSTWGVPDEQYYWTSKDVKALDTKIAELLAECSSFRKARLYTPGSFNEKACGVLIDVELPTSSKNEQSTVVKKVPQVAIRKRNTKRSVKEIVVNKLVADKEAQKQKREIQNTKEIQQNTTENKEVTKNNDTIPNKSYPDRVIEQLKTDIQSNSEIQGTTPTKIEVKQHTDRNEKPNLSPSHSLDQNIYSAKQLHDLNNFSKNTYSFSPYTRFSLYKIDEIRDLLKSKRLNEENVRNSQLSYSEYLEDDPGDSGLSRKNDKIDLKVVETYDKKLTGISKVLQTLSDDYIRPDGGSKPSSSKKESPLNAFLEIVDVRADLKSFALYNALVEWASVVY